MHKLSKINYLMAQCNLQTQPSPEQLLHILFSILLYGTPMSPFSPPSPGTGTNFFCSLKRNILCCVLATELKFARLRGKYFQEKEDKVENSFLVKDASPILI